MVMECNIKGMAHRYIVWERGSMSWKYLLFDLDGTLTDSSEGILNCVIYALEAAGIEVPDRETLLQFVGPPLIEGFQDIIGMDRAGAVQPTAKYRDSYGVTGTF